MQAVIRSASGTNSLQSRITSGVQSSAALGSWAAVGVAPVITNKAAANPAAQPTGEIFIWAPVASSLPSVGNGTRGKNHVAVILLHDGGKRKCSGRKVRRPRLCSMARSREGCHRNCHRTTRDRAKLGDTALPLASLKIRWKRIKSVRAVQRRTGNSEFQDRCLKPLGHSERCLPLLFRPTRSLSRKSWAMSKLGRSANRKSIAQYRAIRPRQEPQPAGPACISTVIASRKRNDRVRQWPG